MSYVPDDPSTERLANVPSSGHSLNDSEMPVDDTPLEVEDIEFSRVRKGWACRPRFSLFYTFFFINMVLSVIATILILQALRMKFLMDGQCTQNHSNLLLPNQTTTTIDGYVTGSTNSTTKEEPAFVTPRGGKQVIEQTSNIWPDFSENQNSPETEPESDTTASTTADSQISSTTVGSADPEVVKTTTMLGSVTSASTVSIQ